MLELGKDRDGNDISMGDLVIWTDPHGTLDLEGKTLYALAISKRSGDIVLCDALWGKGTVQDMIEGLNTEIVADELVVVAPESIYRPRVSITMPMCFAYDGEHQQVIVLDTNFMKFYAFEYELANGVADERDRMLFRYLDENLRDVPAREWPGNDDSHPVVEGVMHFFAGPKFG